MKQMSGIFLLLSIAVLMAGCKLAVIVVEGGEVQSNSSGTCVEGTICVHQVSDTNYAETFTAIPNSGWAFVKWNSGDGFFCQDSTAPTCVLSLVEAAGNAGIEEVVASDKTFYLMPVFMPLATITVDGKEWTQANQFFNLSWDEINAVCPAGVCGDTGTLNGYDMTGWTWASVDDVKALFNIYIGDNVLGPETDWYQDIDGLATNRFFEAGWQPTYEGGAGDSVVTEWRVILRDSGPRGTTRIDAGTAYASRFYDIDFFASEGTISYVPGEFQAAGFNTEVGELDDDDAWRRGAVFHR